MNSSIRHVLVVDDDPDFLRIVTIGLESAGIEHAAAGTVDEALAVLAANPRGHFDLILLDIAMPGRRGWELVDELRSAGNQVPVIFVSSLKGTDEKVRALRLGGDDYVEKPFELDELLARMDAVVRRRRELAPLVIGELSLDLAYRRAERVGKELPLSPREFDLLLTLARARGDVLSRVVLLRDVWNLEFDPETNVLDVHLGRLRRKLDRHGRPAIETVRGEGYRLKTENLGQTATREQGA